MIDLDFDAREMTPDCPSEMALERYRLGRLDGEAHARLTPHVDDCPSCRQWLATAAEGLDGLPGFDHRPVLAAVRRVEPTRPWWRWTPWVMSGLAMAAAAAFFFLRPSTVAVEPVSPGVDGIRLKGKAALRVFRSNAEGEGEIESGTPVQPGDRVRFAVDLPGPGRVEIVGVEPDGDLYTAWPMKPSVEAVLPKGRMQVLEGTAELDDTLGTEALYLVHCPDREAAPGCERGETVEAGPRCPEGCTRSRFDLLKVAPAE